MNSIKLNIKDFFKSIKSEFNLFSDLVKVRDDLKIKYNNDLLKINLKKEKLWTQMDFSKWELNESEKIDRSLLSKDKNYAFKRMFSKDTNILNNLHNKLGYYNKMIIDELKRMVTSHVRRFGEEIKLFSDEFYPSLTDVKSFLFLIQIFFIILLIRGLMFGLIWLRIFDVLV